MSSCAQALQKRDPVGSAVKVVMKNKDEYYGGVLGHGNDYLVLTHQGNRSAF